MAGATALFVCMNTVAKALSASLPPVEVVWARSAGHFLVVAAFFGPRHGWRRLFTTRRRAVQMARSMLQVSSQMFFFTAIGRVPLADATSVSFTAPLIVAGLAGPVLGERVSPSHWLAIGTGFLGALIIIRPGAGLSPYLALIVGSAMCYALYQILTRQVAGVDSAETNVTYSALVGSVVLSVIVPFFWVTPGRAWHWLGLASLGVLGGAGHYFVARAFAAGPASIIAPFHYAQLIWAAVLGYLVFGEVPGAATWVGAAVIIGSGLYIALRELQRW